MKKTLRLVKIGKDRWIYSNYTGAIEPVTIRGFIHQVRDLFLPEKY